MKCRDFVFDFFYGRLTSVCLFWGILVAMLVVFPGTPKANDASFEGQGASVYMAEEKRIRMTGETVDIRYNPLALKDGAGREWTAHCEFRFENLTNENVDVQMGFPDWEAFSESLGDKWAIGNFEARVNGEPVRAVRKEVTSAPGGKRVLLPGGGEIPYDAAYTWPVTFKARGVVVVRNRYTFGGASSMGPFSEIVDNVDNKERTGKAVVRRESVFWTDDGEAGKGFPDYGNSAYREILYIATTGLSWAGSIGEADISMELPPDILPHLVIAHPPGHRFGSGKIRWRFKNWLPASEIAVHLLFPIPTEDGDERVAPIFRTAREAASWIRIAKRNQYDRDVVKILRNAVYAKYGALFEDPEANRRFRRFYWYEPKKPLHDIVLSPEDKRIVSLLNEFEESLPGDR